MSNRGIPVVDLELFINGNKSEKEGFIKDLGDAFRDIGFVCVKNHSIPQLLIDDFYEKSRAFFALDYDTKSKYEIKGLAGQRGYTSFGKEHAKQSDVGDLKEFLQIGQTYADGSIEEGTENPKIVDIDDFSKVGDELYKAFEKSGSYLLRAISAYLGLESSYFDSKIMGGTSILRTIYYPPITKEPATAIRADEHEDINLITLLVGASAGGLEVMDKNNSWIPIKPEENEIAINVGDMLQRLCNGHLKSTTHRVVNPPKEEWHTDRLSIPFFLHPKPNMDLSVLDSCITESNPKQYEDITAGEYLDQRLREIGLKK